MASEQLLQYIVREEQDGFSEDVIRRTLKQNGYTTQQIDEAFSQLQGGYNHDVHGYVQEYARQGQTAEQTFQQLRDQGYEPGEIRHSIRQVYGATEPGGHHTAMFVLVAFIIGAGGMYLLGADLTTVITDQPTYSPGEHIQLALEDARSGRDGISSCTERLDGKYREQCYAVIAAETEDPAVCSGISSDEIHDSCWMTFIDEDFDLVCENVRMPSSKETCASISALRSQV